jgi:hypothetical protein
MVVLIRIANVLYVISYLVKEILWLRLLTVVAGGVLIAYYALLPVPLWAAIVWNVVFLAINLRQIRALLLERRPVRLSPDELRLYQLAFRRLTQIRLNAFRTAGSHSATRTSTSESALDCDLAAPERGRSPCCGGPPLAGRTPTE